MSYFLRCIIAIVISVSAYYLIHKIIFEKMFGNKKDSEEEDNHE